MPQPHVVIITRPGDVGRACTEELTRAGFDAVWWPAFDIALTPSVAAQAALAHLTGFDCVVFVSVSAVAAAAKIRGDTPWPRAVAIAAVGCATAAAARAALRLPDDMRVIAPADDTGESGSEMLWPLLKAAAPRRVLIARAQRGREWLADQLQAGGAAVTSVAVYSRVARPLSQPQRESLLRWVADGVRTVTVFSSSEAVDLMLEPAVDEATRALRRGVAVATHPRIAERLRQHGVDSVIAVSTLTNLIETLRSLEFPP